MNVAQPLETPQVDDIDFLELDRIIEDDFSNDKENLIMILQAIQRQHNYLPQPALAYLSTKIGIPMSKIYGVATFYNQFRFQPQGRFHVQVCRGTACHVKGAARVKDAFERQLGISCGSTSEDYEHSLETVACVGSCALAPVVVVNACGANDELIFDGRSMIADSSGHIAALPLSLAVRSHASRSVIVGQPVCV